MAEAPWAHVMTSMLGHWLPGDPRGFRDHGHRIHSTGDVEHPPPRGEHAGLHHSSRARLRREVVLTVPQRERIGRALLTKLDRMAVPVAVLAVSARHAHALIRVGEEDAVEVFGRAKQFGSHQLRNDIPGKLWGASSHVVRITDEEQFAASWRYIAAHQDEGAWIWQMAVDRARSR